MKRQTLMLAVLSAWAAAAGGANHTEPREALSVGGGLGRLDARADAALSGHDPGGSFDLNVAYRFRPRFALALDIEGHGQDYATPDFVQAPFLGTVADHMNIATASVTLQAVYSVPIWRTRLHLGGGAGLYRSRLTIDATMMGMPGTVADETANAFGSHVLARWDIRANKNWWVGAEYRRIDASADFGHWTNGSIDVGGVIRYVTLRRQFDPPRWPPPGRSRP